MPSPVGHAIAGLVIAWTAESWPSAAHQRPPRAITPLALTCAVLAALPDIDLMFPGQHRTATHSLTATALTFIIAAGVTGWVTRRIGVRTASACAIAYATHVLLDWMAIDPVFPYGIQALWPFSDRWFISGWDLFLNTERRRPLSAATMLINARALIRELLILVPIAALAWLVRVKATARLPAQVSRRDHTPQ